MYRTETVWFTRNPTWIDEFSFNLNKANDCLKIIIHEQRKKGTHKKIGEVKLLMKSLSKNERVEKWWPIIGNKGATVGDVRIRATYSVDVILPSQYYQPLLDLILETKLTVVKLLGEASKDKALLAQELIHLFYARNQADHLIQTFVDEELSNTTSPEVLFRSNTVCTKLIDIYMKLTGSNYLKSVLSPVAEAILKEAESGEIQKEKLKEGEDYVPNLERLKKYAAMTLQRIFQACVTCPPPIRRVLTYLYYSVPRFLDNKNGTIKYLGVTSFIFLRFFVPALLSPKIFGLTDLLPDENQTRIFTLIAGMMQKIANLTKYREMDLYVCHLNDFLESQVENTKDYIDYLVDTRKGTNFMTPSQLTPLQVDRNMASLLRHFSKCKDKFIEAAGIHKEAVQLLNVLRDLDEVLEREKEYAETEEVGIKQAVPSVGYKDIDLLVSKVIETGLSDPNSTRMTIIRPKSHTNRAMSIASKVKNLMPGRKRRMSKAPRYEKMIKNQQQVKSTESQKRADVSYNEIEFRHRYENSPLRGRPQEKTEGPIFDFSQVKEEVDEHEEYDLQDTPTEKEDDFVDQLISQQFEEYDEDDEEEVEVVLMNPDPQYMQSTISEIDSIISEIQSFPVANTKHSNLDDARTIVPEFEELDDIITNIRRTIHFTTPSTVALASDNYMCNGCNEPISVGDKYLTAKNNVYHHNHLLCTICGKDVGKLGFHLFNNAPYCVECYTIINGKYPLCAYCNEPILDYMFTMALNKNWHPEHFVCTTCGCKLEDGVFYSIDDMPYCEKHRAGEKKEDNLPICADCNERILEEFYIEVNGHTFHSHHFCCDICNKPLTDSYVLFERNKGNPSKGCESHFVYKG